MQVQNKGGLYTPNFYIDLYPVKVIIYGCLSNGDCPTEPSKVLSPILAGRNESIDSLRYLIRRKNLDLSSYSRIWLKLPTSFNGKTYASSSAETQSDLPQMLQSSAAAAESKSKFELLAPELG